MIVVETERLVLKRFSLEDVIGFFELNNDPLVMKYTGDRPFNNKDEVVSFIEQYHQYEKYGFGRWSVYLKESNKYIGFCGLKMSPEEDEVDIGFRLIRKYWNNGFATESAQAGLDLAFNKFNLEKVIARATKDNHASQVVIRKLGMTYHSTFVENGVEWLRYELGRQSWFQ